MTVIRILLFDNGFTCSVVTSTPFLLKPEFLFCVAHILFLSECDEIYMVENGQSAPTNAGLAYIRILDLNHHHYLQL